MHVAFIGSYGLWDLHVATELELAEQHQLRGDTVSWVTCDAAFDSCDTNQGHDPVLCKMCRWKVTAAVKLLSKDVDLADMSAMLTDEDRAKIEALPKSFRSVEELKAFEFEGLDAGWGALSSAIWLARDSDLDVSTPLIPKLLRAGATGYLATKRLLSSGAIDRIYAFNGRMAPMRGILRAAAELSVPCFIHERGQDLKHYALFENAMPHDITYTVKRVIEDWETSELPEAERARIASDWFEGRPKGRMGSWISFVDGQHADGLPNGWTSNRHNIALFTTTEFEYASIGKEWKGHLFESPEAATFAIAEAISTRAQAAVEAGRPAEQIPHLTIRIHPNPDGAKSPKVQAMLAMGLPHVTVVAPTSEVSTYGLMREADVVVTAGSTAGVEATFWNKPSVLAGRGLYTGLGAAHEPKSIPELIEMLLDTELGVADRNAALMYAFHQATRGKPFEFFESDSLHSGTFKGQRIRPTMLQRRILRLRARMASRRK